MTPMTHRMQNIKRLMPTGIGNTIFPSFKLTVIAVLINNPVSAQPSQQELPPYNVTSKSQLAKPSLANSQSFISREDLETAKEIDINALLYSEPSVMVVQNKSSGYSRMNLRGASGGMGLITFDGVPLFSNVAGLYSLRHYPREVVQSIQVERGFDQNISNSRTLGGAIHLQSHRVDDEKVRFHIEGGSQATVNANLAAGLGQDNENVSLVFGYTHIADGTTQSSVPSSIVDPDNYKMGRVLLRADKSFKQGRIEASVYYINAQEETDGPGLTPDFQATWMEDPDGWFSDEVVISQVKGSYHFTPQWQSSLQAAYTIDKQDGALGSFRPTLPQGPFSMNLTSQLGLVDWQNTHILPVHKDLEARIDWGLQMQFQTAETNQNNLHEDQLLLSPNLILSLSDTHWRIQLKSQWDTYKEYGDHLTYALGATWYALPSLSLWANTGTRFRAPAVNEHLHPLFGNPDLQPEQNIGGELGVNWQIHNTRIELSGYWQHFNNMIGLALNSNTGALQTNNIKEVVSAGVDFSIDQQWLHNWHSKINYSYMKAENQQTGTLVPGRPEHRMSLINDWQIIQPLSLRLVLNMHSGLWHDTDNLLFSGSVFRLNALINYRITDNIQLYFRGENLADDTSSEAYNFTYPQRSYYLGTELNF